MGVGRSGRGAEGRKALQLKITVLLADGLGWLLPWLVFNERAGLLSPG